jgi:prephenate dehydrogenase
MKIAVIGAGRMGIWFAKFFLSQGYSVVLSDRKKKKLERLKKELGVETANFVDAVRKADWVLLCVSIDAFKEVVEKISPATCNGQIVMDICSIKDFPVKVMHKQLKECLTLGMHPVFGPGSTTVENKTFVLTPTNRQEEKFAEGFKSWLETKKARVLIMSPQKHDEIMSVVLGLPHFLGLVTCDTLLAQGQYIETKKVAGTTYRMLFTLAEATALENPELFSRLQFSLPKTSKIERMFIDKAIDWLKLIKQKDSEAIVAKMKKLKSKLVEASCNCEESYERMYKMLEATSS